MAVTVRGARPACKNLSALSNPADAYVSLAATILNKQLARIALPNDDLIEKIDKELGRAKGAVKQVPPVIASQ